MDLNFSNASISKVTTIHNSGLTSHSITMINMELTNGCTIRENYDNNTFIIKCPKNVVKKENDIIVPFKKTRNSVETRDINFIEITELEPVPIKGYKNWSANFFDMYDSFGITYY